jgi:outer membrane receptor protein involved in Fe transport
LTASILTRAPRAVACTFVLAAGSAFGQNPSPTPPPAKYEEHVQVTATLIPEDSSGVPASMTVMSGEELRDRGVTDLRGALALAAGIEIAPGGDGGPAGSVPEFWGLKEFDAFLLVVDGTPWGGAFNPALPTLDLNDVDRIEVQRGPAPVMYGATSFVGVIHVVHRAAGATKGSLSLSGGSYESGSGALTLKVPRWAGFDSTLGADFGKVGFADDRTRHKKTHLLWRNRRAWGEGTFHFAVDGTWLRQDPASPHPRAGPALSTDVPLGANHNPAGALLDEDRYFVSAGFERPLSFATWIANASFTRSKQEAFRGFLVDVSADDPNAHGFRETIGVTGLYLDTHLAWTRWSRTRLVAGLDYLHGKGTGTGGDFDYLVSLDGSNPPTSAELPPAADIRIEDRRGFFGAYVFSEWTPAPAWRLEGGVRLNVTKESRATRTLDFASGELSAGDDDRATVRPGGSVGVTWTAWQRGNDRLRLFANYKNTFKPAAIDFGLDSEPEILKPETAQSGELGLRGRLRDGAFAFEISSFLMDFNNPVIAQSIDGLPALTNAGQERFKGIEASLVWHAGRGLSARASYSYHDAKFRDFLTELDGVPTQLAGKRLEMSPHQLAAFGLLYAPSRGVVGSLEGNWVGSRYLNKRNTALADAYFTWSASLGYRQGRWEARAAGRNLNNRRDPVAESELGDAQYYRLPHRRFDVSASVRF